jgi:hypothetical protein
MLLFPKKKNNVFSVQLTIQQTLVGVRPWQYGTLADPIRIQEEEIDLRGLITRTHAKIEILIGISLHKNDPKAQEEVAHTVLIVEKLVTGFRHVLN